MLDNSHVVSMMRTTSNMDYKRIQIINPVWVFHFFDGVKQTQFHGEQDTIGQLDVFLERFLVLESLQMQAQDIWENLNFHPTMIKHGRFGLSITSSLPGGVKKKLRPIEQ